MSQPFSQPRLWPQRRCRRRAGWLPSGAGAVGKPPSVHTVLAGAEVFHLPQFLLIKRMNYISVASSGNLSPFVLGAPRGALLLLKERAGRFMRHLSDEVCWLLMPGGWSRSALGSRLCPSPALRGLITCLSPGPLPRSFLPAVRNKPSEM